MAGELIGDGSTTFLGGQDASKNPDLIAENAYAAGVNVTAENGTLGPRWGLRQRVTVVESTEGITLPNLQVRSFEDIYFSGRFQMAAPYFIGEEAYIVTVRSGVVFLVNVNTYVAEPLPIQDGSYLNENAVRLNWANAGKYLVIFDYPSRPVIIEGTTARRADPAEFEVPISTLGAYNQNRLVIANAGNEFTAGDPVGNLVTPDAPITFTEVEQVGSPYFGQIFQVPTDYPNEPITAIGFLQSVDSSTGIGPCLVSTRNAIYSYQTQNPRNTWQAGQFGSSLVYNAGIAGSRAMVNVNGDLFYVSTDGQVRSLSMSRQEQSKWTKIPLSREVKNWLKYWDTSLIPYVTLAYYKNKILVTANPFRVDATNQDGSTAIDVAFGGFVVLELDNLATLTGQSSNPSWAGLWTGVRPMEMVTIGDRLFVLSKDASSRNELYEFDPSLTYDVTADGVRYIDAYVDSRTYSFQNEFQDKSIHSIDLNVADVSGKFEMEVLYKPSHGSKYIPWRNFSHYAPFATCAIPTGEQLKGFTPHNFKNITLGSPSEEVCDPVTRDYYSWFRKLQVRIKLKGRDWTLESYRIKAIQSPQNENETNCAGYPSVATYGECDTSWSIPERTVCRDNTIL